MTIDYDLTNASALAPANPARYYEVQATARLIVHARPAGVICDFVSEHKKAGGGDVHIIYRDKVIDAHSIGEVLQAGIPEGALVHVRASGIGRVNAAHGLAEIIGNGLEI
jgi:phosphotransferase system HPr (HPr) family protein